MKKTSNIIIGCFLSLEIISLIQVILIFPEAITTTDTPGIYLLHIVGYLLFSSITFYFLFQYIRSRELPPLRFIELSAVIILLITIIIIMSNIQGFFELFYSLFYFALVLIILGLISYYKSKRRTCLSFISWGMSVLIWISSMDYIVHLEVIIS